MEDKKKQIRDHVLSLKEELVSLSHAIYDHPEYGFEEYFACEQHTKLLKKHGFLTETNAGGLPTAFVAVKRMKKPGPRVAFLAEYDALEGLGHGCAHNIVGAMATGAGIALSDVADSGEIYVIGTPGEETKGGKIRMLEQGVFDQMDFVLMCHPTAGPSMVQRSARGCTTVYARFTGKAAHSSAPYKGVNALTAVRAMFSNIDLMYQAFWFQDTINGVIREGGAANNIVPEVASCEFCLRSRTLQGLERLADLTKRCADAAAFLTGTTAEVSVDPMFSERYPNIPMGEAFKKNLESLGEVVEYADPMGAYGSSDVSNISLYKPVIHEYISIAPEGVNEHSKEFLEAAGSERGDEGLLLGAAALAMTGYDILSDETFQKEIRDSFLKQVPEYYRKQRRI